MNYAIKVEIKDPKAPETEQADALEHLCNQMIAV